MWLVALDALGNHAMFFGVAEVAGHLLMFAGAGLEFLTLLLVTGKTDLLEFPFQGDIEGHVGVVAGLAPLEVVVGCAAVAVAALGNVLGHLRPVAFVAGLAGDRGLVSRPLLRNLHRFAVMALGAVGIAEGRIGWKRRRIRSIKKEDNFECGIEIKGNARFPFSVKYFLIAILFVLFDVEVIFFYPWAANFKNLGWNGFWEMMVFIGFFLSGFYYIHKKGALDWNN
jgi:NADH-quinone oxidoreductase subunit A